MARLGRWRGGFRCITALDVGEVDFAASIKQIQQSTEATGRPVPWMESVRVGVLYAYMRRSSIVHVYTRVCSMYSYARSMYYAY